MSGLGGNDTILTGTGRDVIDGGSGDNRINADQTNFNIPTSGSDGVGGDYIVTCGDGADIIATWGGNDEVHAGGGVDQIFTGDGNDVIYAGGGSSMLLQEVQAGRGNDRLYGGDDRDNLRGGEDNDILFGGGGNDRVFGEAGADELFGRDGLDQLSGGTGNDIYDYDYVTESKPGAANRDVIPDFNGVGAAVGDRIDLSTIDANTGVSGNQAFVFEGSGAIIGPGQVHVVASGTDTLIQGRDDDGPAPCLGESFHPMAPVPSPLVSM